MALEICNECGAAISRAARTCPHCGGPRYRARLRQELFVLGIQVVGIAGVVFWVGWQVGLLQV